MIIAKIISKFREAEEAKNTHRTIPVATYIALGMIAVIYAAASWAMAAHTGTGHVAATAGKQGPGLLFGLGSSTVLGQVAQVLFMTSLFAAALAFHNATWRYAFALGRENVLPAFLGRTGRNNIPKAASLAQSATAVIAIGIYAVTGQDPMSRMFFWLGSTGGYGILLLLLVTAVAIVAFFARDARGESAWRRLIAPTIAAVLLGGIVILATRNYATLLGVPPGSAAAWILPGSYLAVAVIGEVWALVLSTSRPDTYAAVGLGPYAATSQLAAFTDGTR